LYITITGILYFDRFVLRLAILFVLVGVFLGFVCLGVLRPAMSSSWSQRQQLGSREELERWSCLCLVVVSSLSFLISVYFSLFERQIASLKRENRRLQVISCLVFVCDGNGLGFGLGLDLGLDLSLSLGTVFVFVL
jgi:hypothetical protein